MRSDIDIAQEAQLRPIAQIAGRLGLEQQLVPYGKYAAKIPPVEDMGARTNGRLILVTAMTPTKYGEGKTTNTIGLAQAFAGIGLRSSAAIREPSLGPCMGIKGGAAGGGYSQVLPMEEINLHFTGDMHAVTAAHNLLSAMIDNHIHQQNEPRMDPSKVTWKRVIDMNDRALRSIVIGIGNEGRNGQAREDGFEITAASEVMAILALSSSAEDLKTRLGRIIVGYGYDKKPVTASDLKAQGAMAALLKQALWPNLVQSIEGIPVFVHGGPFANIAHGTNTILATKLALATSDIVVTEAGFASDLGAEKFFNITSRIAGFAPDAAVIVVTLRAVAIHGIENVLKHVENVRMHGVPAVISINRFADDDPAQLEELRQELEGHGVKAFITDFRESGGKGGEELAVYLKGLVEQEKGFTHLYESEDPLTEKIEKIAKRVYGAQAVVYQKGVRTALKRLTEAGYGSLPVCMAKTQMSLSDDPRLTGRPEGFEITISSVALKAGAGFIVVYTGEVMTMPGLPARPSACDIDIDTEGRISGLF